MLTGVLPITANTDTKSIAMVFVGRAIGGATGAVLFAMVLSRCHPWRIISVAYIAMATSLASLPWIGHVIGVAAMYGLGGMGYCIADVDFLSRLPSHRGRHFADDIKLCAHYGVIAVYNSCHFQGLTLSKWFTCSSGTQFWKFTCPAKMSTCPTDICTSPVKLTDTAEKRNTCPYWKITCPVEHITIKFLCTGTRSTCPGHAGTP